MRKTPQTTIPLDEATRRRIDNYRRRQEYIPTMGSVILELVNRALDVEEAAGK